MKVYYLTNAPTPYKIAFWEELGKYCELIVLLEVDHSNERDNSWKSDKREHYQEIIMPHLFRRSAGAFCPSVTRYLKKQDGIVVINGYNTLTGIFSILYSKMHRLPYVISADGGLLNQDLSLIASIKRFLIKGASGYLSSGKITDEYLIHYGADKCKIGHYPFTSVTNSQVLEKPTPDEEKTSLRKELEIHEKKMILTVGQFIHRKGFDVLLNACVGLENDIGVYIIGGEATEEYKLIVESNHLNGIHFMSFMQPSELRKFFLAADIFVLPTREDIWGLVVNEAMAYGLPVITTKRCVSGMEMIRNGDTGIIVDVEDVVGLRNAIIQLLGENRFVKSQNALVRAREYTIEEMAKHTINYLDNHLT